MQTIPLVTAEELFRMPDDDFKYELVDGRLIKMSPTGAQHGVIAIRLAAVLNRHVEDRGLGVALTAGFKLRSDPDTVREPDIAFVRRERIPASGVPVAYWLGPPDLAVEVISPTDRPGYLKRKVADYLSCGVQMIWVIHPRTRTVTVYRPGSPPAIFAEADTLDGADVIPGFTYQISRLFA